MRSDETLTLAEFLQLMREQKDVALRMVLTRENDLWTLYQTSLTVAPDVSRPVWFCYDYGAIAFFAIARIS